MSRFVFEMAGSGAACQLESIPLATCFGFMKDVLTDDFLALENAVAFAALRLVSYLQQKLGALDFVKHSYARHLSKHSHLSVRLFFGHTGPELTPNLRDDVFRRDKEQRFIGCSPKKWQKLMQASDHTLHQLTTWKKLLACIKSCQGLDCLESRGILRPPNETIVVAVAQYSCVDMLTGVAREYVSVHDLWAQINDNSQLMLKIVRAAMGTNMQLDECMLSKRLKGDKAFMQQLVQVNRWAYSLADDSVKADYDVSLAAACASSNALQFVPLEVLSRDFIKQVLESYSKDGCKLLPPLSKVSNAMQRFFEVEHYFFLDVVRLDESVARAVPTCSVEFACSMLQRNVKVIHMLGNNRMVYSRTPSEFAALVDATLMGLTCQDVADHTATHATDALCGFCPQQISDDTMSKLRIYFLTCKPSRAHIHNLSHMVKLFADDKDVMLRCAKTDEETLRFSKLKKDEAFLMQILSENGNALKLCSATAKNTEAIVRLAISSSPQAIKYASQRLRSNPELALKAIASISTASQSVLSFVRDDLARHDLACQTAVFKAAIQANAWEILYLRPCQMTKELACQAVERDAKVFVHLPDDLQNDYDVAKLAAESKYNIDYSSFRSTDPRILQLL